MQQRREEQIKYALRQHGAGTPVEDVCRQLGVSHATFRCGSPAREPGPDRLPAPAPARAVPSWCRHDC